MRRAPSRSPATARSCPCEILAMTASGVSMRTTLRSRPGRGSTRLLALGRRLDPGEGGVHAVDEVDLEVLVAAEDGLDEELRHLGRAGRGFSALDDLGPACG